MALITAKDAAPAVASQLPEEIESVINENLSKGVRHWIIEDDPNLWEFHKETIYANAKESGWSCAIRNKVSPLDPEVMIKTISFQPSYQQ